MSDPATASASVPALQTVVVATDLSQASHAALRVAAEIAVRNGSKLIIAHVIERPDTHAADVFDHGVESEIMADADSALREAVSHLPGEFTTHLVDIRLLHGRALPELLKLAGNSRADLLVTGTHGRDGIDTLVLGSIAEKLARKAPCPVLVVKPDFHETHFSRPMVAVDFSDDAVRAVRRGLQLCQAFGLTRLALLHVYDVPQRYIKPGITPQQAAEAVRAHVQETGTTWLDHFSGQHSGITLELTLQAGSPGTAIPEFALAHGTDLIVMGTRGRTAAARMLLGSVTERVLRAACVSVLAERTAQQSQDFFDALREWFS
ncbi:MAG: universal stress protein [Planctomycetota bacterium]